MKDTYTAGVLEQNDKFLLVYHMGVKRWVFPGGKPECDENAWQCIVRELKEEIGVEVHHVEFAHVVPSTITPKGDWFGIIFRVLAWLGEPRIMEPKAHGDIHWFSAKDITWEPERGIVEKIIAMPQPERS